jgi:hypothetical protein
MIVHLPDDKVRADALERVRPYWDEWAKATSPEAVEVLAKVRKAVGK